jgi:hypothetical protein
MDLQQELDLILRQPPGKTQLSSELGFFSKPIRIRGTNGADLILKLYRPLKKEEKAKKIIECHEQYIVALRSTGIMIPPTAIGLQKLHHTYQIVILQPAFDEIRLVRTIAETCFEIELLALIEFMLNDTLTYWKNKPRVEIGFHPTMRNYAFDQGKLHYFDTFPPMLMPQKELNRLIIDMAPARLNIRALIPNRIINRVSDEYYQKDKMITGIIGSACRLRPELSNAILSHCRNYISKSADLKDDEKSYLLDQLKRPPQLSGIWITFRKIFGKTGRPNVK